LACHYLKRNGYKVLFRNFRGRSGGEIDIVCRDNDTLVFVEVKTRGCEDFGRPVEAIDPEKRSAFLVVPWPGYECWIIPIFFSDLMLLKSSSRTARNRASN
jgi:hypothetical protein